MINLETANSPQIAVVAVGCFALGMIVGKALGIGDTERIAAAVRAQVRFSAGLHDIPLDENLQRITVLRVEQGPDGLQVALPHRDTEE